MGGAGGVSTSFLYMGLAVIFLYLVGVLLHIAWEHIREFVRRRRGADPEYIRVIKKMEEEEQLKNGR